MSTQSTNCRYENAQQAIDWLCQTLGFSVFLLVPEENAKPGFVKHARLTLGNNMLMLASAERDSQFDNQFISPHDCHGVTQCTMLYVEDPEAIYQQALAAKAEIIDPLQDFPFGGASFSCKDPEGHVWGITSHDPWKKTW